MSVNLFSLHKFLWFGNQRKHKVFHIDELEDIKKPKTLKQIKDQRRLVD